MPLTDRSIKLAEPKEKPYRISDSGGLYIEVHPNGSKYWRLKYRFAKKEKKLALGVYPSVTLKQAREKRDEYKKILAEGKDPSLKIKEQKLSLSSYYENSFENIAKEWREVKMADRSEKYMRKVESSFRRDVLPFIGDIQINDIEPPLVLSLLRRVEDRGAHETAHRIKMWVGLVFRYAIATGRCRRNPTEDLKGALKPHKTKHFSAITDVSKVGKLMSDIYRYQGTPQVVAAVKCSAMWFLRPVELRNLEWVDVNWEKRQLEIVAAKSHGELLHIVPLSAQSYKILEDLREHTGHGIKVFAGARSHLRGISENTVVSVLRYLGYSKEEMSAHGFRAMARTILDEELEFDEKLTEKQLAHMVKDMNGRAYNRTAHLKLRREMMQKWSDFLDEKRLEYERSVGLIT